MSSDIQVITNPMLNVFISSNVASFGAERRFNKDLTISAFKEKLELVMGASSASMKLEVYDKEDKLVCKLDNDDALLGSYQINDNMRIHVIDTSGQSGQFEDTSKVEKFEISKEAYEKRGDSVRAFKERMKLGQFTEVDPNEKEQLAQEKAAKAQMEADMAKSITTGSRCEVTVAGHAKRRAEVMFVGKTDFQTGYWIGLRYDEPLGKNDGSVGGKRYFDCPPKYGGFVRPNQVRVGDFPEQEIDFNTDEM